MLARSIREASTELSDEKGNSESVSILCSLVDLGLMPLEAALGFLWEWFLIFACARVHSTAVRMVVQDMVRGSKFTSWWKLEANCPGGSACDWERVGGNWLEPHQGVLVVLLVFLVDLGVERGQVDSVSFTGKLKAKVVEWISGERFVKWIVSNNVWVLCETSGSVVPVGDEFVLKTLLVIEKSSPKIEALLRGVV